MRKLQPKIFNPQYEPLTLSYATEANEKGIFFEATILLNKKWKNSLPFLSLLRRNVNSKGFDKTRSVDQEFWTAVYGHEQGIIPCLIRDYLAGKAKAKEKTGVNKLEVIN